MTKRERVINALNHKDTDIVPYDFGFTIQSHKIMVEYSGDPNIGYDMGQHIHSYQYWGWPTEISPGTELFKDIFGVIWDRSGVDKDIGVIPNPPIPDITNHNYIIPLVNEERLRKEMQEFISSKADRFTFAGIGFSMFERAWSLCGMENILVYMLTNPKELSDLLNNITEHNLEVLDIMLEYDIDGIYFGDDWGQQRGMIMGPEHWRQFIKPQMKKMFKRAKQANKFVGLHSCGDIGEVFPDLIEIGLDCYQTFQPEIYDIEKVKQKYGFDLSFWGGISTQQLLPIATPDKVKSETIRIMKIMSKNGGFIAAPTHAIPQDVPPENIIAMIDVFTNQDKYQIGS
jgi:uroporphyrinogen decarboxylase